MNRAAARFTNSKTTEPAGRRRYERQRHRQQRPRKKQAATTESKITATATTKNEARSTLTPTETHESRTVYYTGRRLTTCNPLSSIGFRPGGGTCEQARHR